MMDDPVQPKTNRHTELQAALGDLPRAANASIRGYLTQVLYSVLAWLDLGEDEVLVVEGREDLDRILLDPDGCVREVNEVQLKDLSEAVNARSEAVWESIFNFLLSHQYHQDAGRSAQMLFATTASLKTQTTATSTGLRQTAKTMRLDLEVDIVSAWSSLPELEDDARSSEVEKLARAVRGLFDAHLRPLLPDPSATAASAEAQRAQSVLAAIELHDANSTWSDFLSAVSWLTEIESASDMADTLRSRIAADPSMSGLPESEFAQVLIYRVLSAASQAEVAERILTHAGLRAIAAESTESLRQWAQRHGLVNLGQWQLLAEGILADHGDRLDELETTVAASLPTPEGAWSSIETFTRSARRRVRVDIGGVHVARPTQLTSLGDSLRPTGVVVILGASGSGKSALVRNYTEDLDSQGGLTLWLGGASLERPDLATLHSDLGLGLPFDMVFDAHPGPKTLVIDGLDRVYENSALALVADLLDVLHVGQPEALCHLVVTCQTSEWPGRERLLRRERVDVSGWVLQECPSPKKTELAPVWDVIPAARRIAHEPRLASLMGNLKILDLVASQIADGGAFDAQRFVGEASVASWYWEVEVVHGPQRRARDALAMRLGELQADQLRLSISLADLQIGDASVVDGLEANRVCVVDERNHVLFAHDLFADWARLRMLQSHSGDLVEYLRTRLDSPLWHRAIRLFGGGLLDEKNDVDGWKALLQSLQDVGGESAADLLLESVVFAANARSHLELLGEELLAPKGGLLDRLLGRFLAFATLPDPRMRELGRSLGVSDAEVSSLCRYPNWPYWPPVLRFLYTHRDRVIGAAPGRVGQVVKLWLDYTPPETGLRREAGELALLLGEFAVSHRWSLDDREDLLEVALAGVPECESEVVNFALLVAERTTIQQQDAPTRSTVDRMHPDFAPNEPMPPPAPDGPRNQVDADFIAVVLKGALLPLMRRRPAIAREVILACLLASRHTGAGYRYQSDEWDLDLACTRGTWSPPGHFRGPFAALLQVDYAEGLDAIARLLDFVTAQWAERRQREGGRDQYLYDPDSPGLLRADIAGVSRTFAGDGRTLGWSAGLGLPLPNGVLTSALMALEQHLYKALDSKADVESMVRAVLERTQSVPMLHVLLDVGRKEQSLFAGPLLPLLGIPELYWWEITVQIQRRSHLTLCSSFEGRSVQRMLQEFNSHPHRTYDLRQIAQQLFLTNQDVSEFLTATSTEWARMVEELQPGRERDRLQQLVMMFNKDNYEVVDVGNGRVGLQNVALQEREEAMREEMSSHNEAASLAMLQIRCRQLLDEGEALPEDELQALVSAVKCAESAWNHPVEQPSAPEDIDGSRALSELDVAHALEAPANALAGGIAVLLCLHYDWVVAQPELLTWCRDSLSGIMLNPPPSHSVPESVSTWTWDCFAAEAIVVLWQHDPENLDLRRMVAILAFSNHNAAVAILMRRTNSMAPARFEDMQRLRRLVFEHAYIRSRLRFVRQLTQERDQLEEEELQESSRNFDGWYQQQLEEFAEGRSEAPTTKWGQMDSSGILAHRDESRRARFGGYLPDFRLLRAAHEAAYRLDEATSTQEREYRAWFLKSALGFWVALVTGGRPEDARCYPGDDERWLLDKLAAAVSVMKPEEKPEEIWAQILSLPPEAHCWSKLFLDSFFRLNLAADPVPEALFSQICSFIDRTLALPPEQRWESREDVWQALFGVHEYTRALWQGRHAEVATSLWPSVKEWVSQERVAPTHVGAVARWLVTEAAASLRLDGLCVLRDAVSSSDSWWSNHDRKFAEDAVADLLQLVWDEDAAAVRRSDDVRAAFQLLLRWLGDRQNRLGLELLGRIGNL